MACAATAAAAECWCTGREAGPARGRRVDLTDCVCGCDGWDDVLGDALGQLVRHPLQYSSTAAHIALRPAGTEGRGRQRRRHAQTSAMPCAQQKRTRSSSAPSCTPPAQQGSRPSPTRYRSTIKSAINPPGSQTLLPGPAPSQTPTSCAPRSLQQQPGSRNATGGPMYWSSGQRGSRMQPPACLPVSVPVSIPEHTAQHSTSHRAQHT